MKQDSAEPIDDRYDRDYTSSTCCVCRDLWSEIDRLRGLLADREEIEEDD